MARHFGEAYNWQLLLNAKAYKNVCHLIDAGWEFWEITDDGYIEFRIRLYLPDTATPFTRCRCTLRVLVDPYDGKIHKAHTRQMVKKQHYVVYGRSKLNSLQLCE